MTPAVTQFKELSSNLQDGFGKRSLEESSPVLPPISFSEEQTELFQIIATTFMMIIYVYVSWVQLGLYRFHFLPILQIPSTQLGSI